MEDAKQLARSSGAIGANYIEANQHLGKRDFLMRAKIAKKEAKESCFWLRLVDTEMNTTLEAERIALAAEADQLTRIFGAMVRNLQQRTEH